MKKNNYRKIGDIFFSLILILFALSIYLTDSYLTIVVLSMYDSQGRALEIDKLIVPVLVNVILLLLVCKSVKVFINITKNSKESTD